jgi:hypothetical protein
MNRRARNWSERAGGLFPLAMQFPSNLALTAVVWVALVAATALPAADAPWKRHGPLRATADGHGLVHADGTPWFWLGDTAWALHQNLSRADVLKYLDDVQQKGFTVIQLMAANRWALKGGKNLQGYLPYLRDDPTHLNPLYWEHLGWVIDEAARRHLYALLVFGGPGRKDERLLFVETPEQAYAYGRAAGFGFRDKPNLIWSNGIDVNPDDTNRVSEMGLAGWHAMAEGVADGVNGTNRFDGRADYSTTLMTYHPRGGSTSSAWFHEAPWLDFNGVQIGLGNPDALWQTLAGDYRRTPPKPVINLEPWYEGAPWKQPPVNDWEVRLQAYQSLFAGAFGHTYGHTYIWAFDSETESGWKWRVHLEAPGRTQMRHVRTLMESLPFNHRMPDLAVVVGSPGNAHESPATRQRIATTGDPAGTWALVYSPQGAWFDLDLSRLKAPRLSARWFDPRTGTYRDAGEHPASGRRRFDPPGPDGEGHDWVLVLTAKPADAP